MYTSETESYLVSQADLQSYHIVQADFRFKILLPQPPKCQDERCCTNTISGAPERISSTPPHLYPELWRQPERQHLPGCLLLATEGKSIFGDLALLFMFPRCGIFVHCVQMCCCD